MNVLLRKGGVFDVIEYSPEEAERKLPVSLDDLVNEVSQNPSLEHLFERMLGACLEYTKCVTEYIRAERDDPTPERTVRVIEAGGLKRNLHELIISEIRKFFDAIPNGWRPNPGNRAAFSKFAICITIARLRG